MTPSNFLAVDVGATKVHAALGVVYSADRFEIQHSTQVPIAGVSSFCDLVDQVQPHLPRPLERIELGGGGAAGRLEAEVIHHKDYPCALNVGEARKRFHWPRVSLFNDTEAQAWILASNQCNQIARPIIRVPEAKLDNSGGAAVVAPGTGLGLAGFVKGKLIRSEAGHGPAPLVNIEAEIPFLRFVQSKLGAGELRLESLVCGQALAWCHEFHYGEQVSARDVTRLLKSHPKTIDTFAWYLGQAIRIAVMDFWATRGVYLFGGVLSRNPEILEIEPGVVRPALREGMLASATWRDVMERVPVFHLSDPNAAVKGIIIGAAYQG